MTPPRPSRETPAGRAYNDLRNLARRNGRDPAEYFTLFALEAFLARLTTSEYADDFVLKGGVLMAAFAERRPTRDIDLAASGFTGEIPEVERRIRAVLDQDLADGVAFDGASMASGTIREEGDYAGVRVKVVAWLSTARIALHVDVNFGDPIWPAPTYAALPLLLGGSLRLLGYPDHMVVAEKIVTAIERGDENTRWRDFVDIVAIARTRRIGCDDLAPAIGTVAQYRQVKVQPLGPLLKEMASLAQRRWSIWRRKQRLEHSTPESFSDLLDSYLAFADPVLEGRARGLRWDPVDRAWVGERREGTVTES